MSLRCFKLLNCASSVTNRSPWPSTAFLRPSLRSTKNGLFMVWNVTPKRRPPVAGGAPEDGVVEGDADSVDDLDPHPVRNTRAAAKQDATADEKNFIGAGAAGIEPIRAQSVNAAF